MAKPEEQGVALRTGPGFNAILQSLTKIVAKLSALSREELKRSACVDEVEDPRSPAIVGIHGFTLRSLPGGSGFLLDPFGNVRVDEKTGAAWVMDTYVPITHVTTECGQLVVQAEVPGISPSEARFEFQADRLVFNAEHGERKYRKEIELDCSCRTATAKLTGRAGLIEIRISLA